MTRDDNVEVIVKVVRNGVNMPGSVTIASFSSSPSEESDAADKAVKWINANITHNFPTMAIRMVNTDTNKIIGSINWTYNEETGEDE